MYYTESIRSPTGFYAWPCSSYISYLLRMCPAASSNLHEAGEHVRGDIRGMHFLKTRDQSPFALGRGGSNRVRQHPNDLMLPPKRRDPLLEEIDQWGKLDGGFNNIDHYPTPLPQDPLDDWDYFGAEGPSQIAQQNNYYYGSENEDTADADGPYGIQVLDVLHRKQPTSSDNRRRRRPTKKWRVKAKTTNASADDTHLIQKLWEDYNSAETEREEIPYWRHRQAYRGGGGGADRNLFFTQPRLRGQSDEFQGRDDQVEITTRKQFRPGH